MSEDRHGLTCIGHSDLGGYGDGMQPMRSGDALYVGHQGTSGMGTSVLDVSDPTRPVLVEQWTAPQGSHTHKVQVADGLLLTNIERFRGGRPYSAGMMVYDLSEPFHPRPVGLFRSTGEGVHRIVWTGGDYAYVSATPDGFDDRIWVIVDMTDPPHPVEAGRWWWPGMWRAGGEQATWPDDHRPAAHHALVDGDLAYLGFWDVGLVVLDISDRAKPEQIGHLAWSPGGQAHTCLPLPTRGLVVVTEEVTVDDCQGGERNIHVVDVRDPRAPAIVGTCPVPEGDFCERGLRFGPHNLHENRPGSYISERLVFATYFNAGVRVFDLGNPSLPVEVAHWVPDTPPGQRASQLNDLFVDEDGLVYVTDRIGGGVYILQPDHGLADLMDGATGVADLSDRQTQ